MGLLEDILGFMGEGFEKFAGQLPPTGDLQSARQIQMSEEDIDSLLDLVLQFSPVGATKNVGKLTGNIRSTRGAPPPRGSVPPVQKVIKPQGQFATLAKEGVSPLSPPNKLLPALIDMRTGEVIQAMSPGPGFHDVLRQSAPKNFMGTRGFVDPITFQAFTETMLDALTKVKGLP